MSELWICFGMVLFITAFIILATASKDSDFKIFFGFIAVVFVIFLVFCVEKIALGDSIKSLPHEGIFETIHQTQIKDYTILYLSEVYVDKDGNELLKEPKFYKIETWKLRDENRQEILGVYSRFEVLVAKESIINPEAEKSREKVKDKTIYCLIEKPRYK